MSLWAVVAIIFLLNIPFGYWRASVRKFSLYWFLAVHLPVPFIIALRVFSGLGFALWTFPLFIGAYFAGQFFGARIYSRRADRH